MSTAWQGPLVDAREAVPLLPGALPAYCPHVMILGVMFLMHFSRTLPAIFGRSLLRHTPLIPAASGLKRAALQQQQQQYLGRLEQLTQQEDHAVVKQSVAGCSLQVHLLISNKRPAVAGGIERA